MQKGRKQTADDLIQRYSAETVGLQVANSNSPVLAKKANPVLESLRRNVGRVVMLPLDLLLIEENVRRRVDESSPEFLGLVDSIRANGIRQNIIVDLQDADEDRFKVIVIAGQRRVLAGKTAGVKQSAALVLRLTSRGERLIEGLAENLLREDLHCLDQAEAYSSLLEEGWSEAEIAEKFERRRRTILQFLRLGRYPQAAKDFIRAHADLFTTSLLFNRFVAKSWKSEEELLLALREAVQGKQKMATPLHSTLNRLVNSVNRYNGMSCRAKGDETTGRIVINYKSQAALNKIMSLFEDE